MNRKITVLGGAYSVGKSTLQEEMLLQNPGMIHVIPDHARILLEERGGIAEVQERGADALEDFQLDVMEEYLRSESEALRQPKPILSDGSLIEVLAYSQGVLDMGKLTTLHNLVRTRKHIYQVLHLRPHPDLFEGDGIRHTDLAFQRIIDKRIQDICVMHDIPRMSISTTDLAQRYRVAFFTLLHGSDGLE